MVRGSYKVYIHKKQTYKNGGNNGETQAKTATINLASHKIKTQAKKSRKQ